MPLFRFDPPGLIKALLETPDVNGRSPSPAVRAALMAELFADLPSLTMSVLASSLVALLAFVETGLAWTACWLLALCICGLARVLILRDFRKHNRRTPVSNPEIWARRFLYWSSAKAVLLSVGTLGCMLIHSWALSLMAMMVTAGIASGIASRNAAVPRYANLQIWLLLAPFCAGLLACGHGPDLILVPPVMIFLWAMLAVVRRHYHTVCSLMCTEEENAALAARFNAALSNMPHGLCTTDEAGNVVIANRKTAELFGLTVEMLRLHVPVPDFIAHALLPNFGETLRHEMVKRCRAWLTAGKGSFPMHLSDERQLELRRNPVADGGAVIIIEDVTERRRAEERIVFLAEHDALTGLPNRRALCASVAAALSRLADGAYAVEETLAVLCLDLDGFKRVNDTLGHAVGDEVLRLVGQRLRTMHSHHRTVARLGGDEFVMLVEHATRDDVTGLARRIIELLSNRYALANGHAADLGVSIGIAFAPGTAVSADALLVCADTALYAAKDDGKGTYRIYDQQIQSEVYQRHAASADWRALLAGKQGLELHYQPIFDLRSDVLVAREALLRWRHPDIGLLLPGQFLSLSDETGTSAALAAWVLARACRDAARWPGHVRVAVNVAPDVAADGPALAEMVRAALSHSGGLPPHRLELELTETAILPTNTAIVETLRTLRGTGVRVALDDFGTGWSSLSHLRDLPVDIVKIDGSFVRASGDDGKGAAIAHALIGLCNALDIETVAEGIENDEQLARLRASGCRYGQGFLLGRPAPVLGDAVAPPAQAKDIGSARRPVASAPPATA
jgi:diguanylate cyclase (GGDEF)-like protein/PAS domain S-box-containing protein